MILGHAATTLVTKRAAPEMPWWVLFVSAFLIDIAMFTFVGLGIETMEPTSARPSMSNTITEMTFSHDLIPQIGWVLLAGAIAFAVARRRAFVLIAMALSLTHWLGDLVSGYGHHVFGPETDLSRSLLKRDSTACSVLRHSFFLPSEVSSGRRLVPDRLFKPR